MTKPLFSVVIPAYNQAEYLGEAIDSALAQTCRHREIIVVDDGSTDATPDVTARFGSCVRYVHQLNQGIAAARNTGIRHAKGAYVALLDADDEWQPVFLATMRRAIAHHPGVNAFYCAAQCMDADGHALPQRAGAHVVPSERLYHAILRANFLIPSTMVIRRSTIVEAGYFDEDPCLRGCEDADLWLRLAQQHTFIGIGDCLVRYRLHDTSMSTDVVAMQRAALAVVEKHFGPDDGQPATWPPDKRRAYGGLYRYNALTSLLRVGDWSACAEQFRRALAADATLAEDRTFFFELALGDQPLGRRGTRQGLDTRVSAEHIETLLATVFAPPLPDALSHVRSAAHGTAYAALAQASGLAGESARRRDYLLRAAHYRPRSVLGPPWWRGMLRSFAPKRG